MSAAADRDRLRAQLASHLERLSDEAVWGLEIPEASAASPSIGEPNPGTLTNPVTEVTAVTAPEVSSEKRASSCEEPCTPSGFRDKSLPEVAAEALQCVACGLHETRTKVVCGIGNPDARLMFIGEGPGFQEDRQGIPFVGPAGKLLDSLLDSIDMSREDVCIANMVKCRPPENRDPAPPELAACAKYLDRQIELVDPKLIVTLGRFAFGRYFPGEGITLSLIHI